MPDSELFVDLPRWGRRGVSIYGLGQLGSHLAVHLHSRGIPSICGIDDDIVEPHNLQNQAFFPDAVGKPKGAGLARLLEFRNTLPNTRAVSFTYEQRKGGANEDMPHVVFVLTDTMRSRQELAESARNSRRISVLFEARVSAGLIPQIRIYCVDPRSDLQFEKYLRTLYDDSAVEQSPGCGVQVDSSISQIASGLLAQRFDRWWQHSITNKGMDPFGEVIFYPRTSEVVRTSFSL